LAPSKKGTRLKRQIRPKSTLFQPPQPRNPRSQERARPPRWESTNCFLKLEWVSRNPLKPDAHARQQRFRKRRREIGRPFGRVAPRRTEWTAAGRLEDPCGPRGAGFDAMNPFPASRNSSPFETAEPAPTPETGWKKPQDSRKSSGDFQDFRNVAAAVSGLAGMNRVLHPRCF